MPSGLRVVAPTGPLRDYVDHYWLSLSNQDDTHTVLPDGAVDLVLSVGQTSCRTALFGTTTARVDLPLGQGTHYLGVRFRAGQSRHFCDGSAAELTDGQVPADGSSLQGIAGLAEGLARVDVFERLDACLLRLLVRHPPRRSGIDGAIQHIESSRGHAHVGALAERYGKSRRQFERDFLYAVGVSPKLFAGIVRFQHALALLKRATLPLAQVAAELGYVDQSHLTRDFGRFYGEPPSRARRHVAFLQDAVHSPEDNTRSR